MAIPKIIHWCWLGKKTVPKRLQKCIDTWKRIMPDYEIKCWNECNFDILSAKFVNDAYIACKWAFAADYIRLHALYTEGGIYLDTDVNVFRRFDDFLHHAAFSSVEYIPKHFSLRDAKNEYTGYGILSAVIGAEKGNGWIEKCLEHYRMEKEFKTKEGGKVDVEVIPDVLARYAHLYYDFQYDKSFETPQYLKENIVIYPPKIFTATYGEADMKTYALHVGDGSWADDKSLSQRKKESKIRKWYKIVCSNYRFFAMLHWKRKQLERKIKNIF